MRESKFIEQNHEKWANFEKELRARKKDPRMLRSQLIEVADDLSYARTFYRNRSVRVYLNGLAQRVFNSIYRNRIHFIRSLKEFYTEHIPRIVYESRKEMLVSFLVLLLSVLTGIFSSRQDEGFARSILGDAYVEMTLENIRNGTPMGVYGSSGQIEMFIQIAVNNLVVSLMVFLSGLLASYGALVLMFRNGVMLGTFMYFFYSRGQSSAFNLTVWMHGTIEILTLVLMTVAGILLGRGLVYPGTYSRSKAFSVWGRKGAMLFLAGVPFIVFAAFIESFLTRYTEMPAFIRATLILLSVALMLLYFVLYPLMRFRGTEVTYGPPEPAPDIEPKFDKTKIYGNGKIFLNAIGVTGSRFPAVIRTVTAVSVLYLLLLFFGGNGSIPNDFRLLKTDFSDYFTTVFSGGQSGLFPMLDNIRLLFNPESDAGHFLMMTLWTGILLFASLHQFGKVVKDSGYSRKRSLIWSFAAAFFASSLLLIPSTLSGFLYVLLSPFIICAAASMALGVLSWQRVHILLTASTPAGILQMTGILMIFLLGLFMGSVFVISPLYYLLVEMMSLNVDMGQADYHFWLRMLMLFSLVMMTGMLLIFYFIQCIFLLFTLHEMAEASGLKRDIQHIGTGKKAYGFETE